MNILSDYLCDSTSLMVPQSYNGPLLSHKMLSSNNTLVTTKKGTMHLIDTLSNISDINRPLSALNNSSPSNIDIFTTSEHQVHLPTSLESSSFHDGSQMSPFTSNSFQEIVPTWLTHDFMKVSDDLPPLEMMPNDSVGYSCTRENESLDMIDLGFPPELTSQDINGGNLNRSHISNTQKLLTVEPLQRFTSADSLLISSFNSMNNSQMQIPVTKNSSHYQKHDSAQSIINSVLPCENELIHIPLSSNITDQCLNTSSPSILPRNQSQTHSVEMVCDKLPQISLTHLDTLLGHENTLPAIQLLRPDFPNVRISEDIHNSSHHNNGHLNQTQSCIENINTNRNHMVCDENFQNPNIMSMSHSQDISVQVSDNFSQQNLLLNKDCSSCTNVPLESPIEITQCFKCKYCSYISLHKCSVAEHLNLLHSKSSNVRESSSNSSLREDIAMNQITNATHSSLVNGEGQNVSKSIALVNVNNTLPLGSENNSWTQLCSETDYTNILIKVINNQFLCSKCDKIFTDVNDCKSHLVSFHSIKLEYLQLNVSKPTENSQQMNINNSAHLPTNEASINKSGTSNDSRSNTNKALKKKCMALKRNIAPKNIDDSEKGSENKKIKNGEPNLQEKKVSSHKEAWRKKMQRELGSYICEFKGCNIRFRALDNLEYHKKCHMSGGNTFGCPECEMKFHNWEVIAGHLWRTHSNDMELHACDQCPFRCYSLGRLENIHKRIHLDECLFLCDTCGKSFKNGKQLRNHRTSHLPNKKAKVKPVDFQCDICHFHFSSKRILQLHQNNVHNKQNMHICSYCDYTSSKSSTMKMHMRQHTGEKPFSCDKCDYRTSDHNSLRRHKMKHSGEKPYKCPYCSYGSIQASTYKAHLKNQHPDQNAGLMFSCNQCSFRTIKQDTYIEHIMEHEQLSNTTESTSNPMPQPIINEDAEMFSLVEAMDISLSHGDTLPNLNKDKINIQSFLRNLNMSAVCNDGVM